MYKIELQLKDEVGVLSNSLQIQLTIISIEEEEEESSLAGWTPPTQSERTQQRRSPVNQLYGIRPKKPGEEEEEAI